MKILNNILKTFSNLKISIHNGRDRIASSIPVKSILRVAEKAMEVRNKSNIASKIFTWRNTKWVLLLGVLAITIIITLMLYDGIWGFGKWTESSHWDGSDAEAGPGQWRFKQVLISFFAGGALAFAGVLLQKITRNNLAEVSLLGIGSINIMFLFAYIMIFKTQVFDGGTIVQKLLPVVTIVASLIGTTIVWILARSKRANRNTFAIIGIALQFLFEALSVVFINPSQLGSSKEGKQIWGKIKNYTMGNMETSVTPFWLIIVAGIVIALCVVIALFLRKKIDIYESNPALAKTLGIKVEGLRYGIFIVVALLAGVEASILGTVALLGLIAPSIARMLFKNKMMPLGIASFIIGGILVMGASIVSMSFGTELPIGILATAIATPYFIILIIRGK